MTFFTRAAFVVGLCPKWATFLGSCACLTLLKFSYVLAQGIQARASFTWATVQHIYHQSARAKGQGWNLRSRSLQPMVAIASSVEIQRQLEETTILHTSIFLSISADHVVPPPDS
ncbi:hypothetical protein EDD22DRAFT_120406 [Suillus occidentalis]|nr:hypothetical protein EDD22DRAFT_120406 [Suillus occidentalis]